MCPLTFINDQVVICEPSLWYYALMQYVDVIVYQYRNMLNIGNSLHHMGLILHTNNIAVIDTKISHQYTISKQTSVG